jgi:DNA-binding response OmpR family regulator
VQGCLKAGPGGADIQGVAPAARRASARRPGGNRMSSVLVVDDNEDNLRVTEEILKTRGFTVRLARDGASALESIDKSRPDVVLLDIMLPDMDGMELLDRLRSRGEHAHLPVILVTAKAQDEDVIAGYKVGADYYITKPFTARQLLHGIGLVLGTE